MSFSKKEHTNSNKIFDFDANSKVKVTNSTQITQNASGEIEFTVNIPAKTNLKSAQNNFKNKKDSKLKDNKKLKTNFEIEENVENIEEDSISQTCDNKKHLFGFLFNKKQKNDEQKAESNNAKVYDVLNDVSLFEQASKINKNTNLEGNKSSKKQKVVRSSAKIDDDNYSQNNDDLNFEDDFSQNIKAKNDDIFKNNNQNRTESVAKNKINSYDYDAEVTDEESTSIGEDFNGENETEYEDSTDEADDLDDEEYSSDGENLDNNSSKHSDFKLALRIIFITFLVIIIGLAIWAVSSPTFNIVNVSLLDSENLKNTDYEIVQNMANNSIGSNIFTYSTANLKNQIESLPYVYRATINRKLPDALQIEIQERSRYAVLPFSGDYYIVDQYARVLEVSKSYSNFELPMFRGIIENKYNSADFLEGTDYVKFSNVLYLQEALENVDFNFTISEINYDEDDEIELKFNEIDVSVKYGNLDKEQTNEKLLYLNKMLDKAKELGYSGTIDISSSNYNEKSVFKVKISS